MTEHVKAVKTLLAIGADPNHNNGRPDSFALVEAAEGSALVLRAMLDGGGDPNGRDEDGVPIILRNWRVSFYAGVRGRVAPARTRHRSHRVAPDWHDVRENARGAPGTIYPREQRRSPEFLALWKAAGSGGILAAQ